MKVAFLHIPKTGGASVHTLLSTLLWRNGKYFLHPCAGGSPVWVRDYTDRELIQIAQNQEPKQYLQNHTPWTQEAFSEFKKNNWFTFSFVRHPGDLMCSWYHFRQARYDEELHRSLEECLRGLFSRPLKWLIPDYWKEIDFIRELTETNMLDLVNNKLGLKYSGGLMRANQSFNLGYDLYCRSGEISKETQQLIESHEQFRRYLAIKELGESVRA